MSALLLYLLHEAAEGVFVVALYRYATTGSGAGAFTADMLHAAFAPREPAWTEVDLSSIHGQAERRLGTWQDLGGTFGTDTGAAGAPPAGSTR
jgi:hypothetical protein